MPPTDTEPTIEYDPEAAERGWNETKGLRAEYGKVPTPRGIDLRQVAILGLVIAAILDQPAVRARFGLLHRELFDQALLDRIRAASWALWFAYNARLTAGALVQEAQLSPETAKLASELKSTMLRVADYFLADHADKAEVASIRSGTGHKDTASDLFRLAKLYGKHRTGLATGGGKHYREGDERAAKEMAVRILTELGTSDQSEEEARNDLACAFEVLEDAYAPVQRFAHAIFPERIHQFPSLWSVRPTGTAGRGDRSSSGTEDGSDDTQAT